MNSKNIWQGRIDDDADRQTYRWHQCLGDQPASDGLSIIGFACDIGVARNHGRTGARHAPDAIKSMLANLPANSGLQQRIFDAGNVVPQTDELDATQRQLSDKVAQLLPSSGRVLVLGGGHETAWGSFMGLAQHAETQSPTPRIGIINFDAHFDLRSYADGASSGSPFLQIHAACQARRWDFNYACLGVSEAANTAALFNTAERLGVWYCHDSDMSANTLPKLQKQLAAFTDKVDWLYVSIDLDVLPAAVAPGVSAPAALGVEMSVIETLIRQIVASDKIKLADIVECNPNYDIDNRTARVAARLAYWLSCKSSA